MQLILRKSRYKKEKENNDTRFRDVPTGPVENSSYGILRTITQKEANTRNVAHKRECAAPASYEVMVLNWD